MKRIKLNNINRSIKGRMGQFHSRRSNKESQIENRGSSTKKWFNSFGHGSIKRREGMIPGARGLLHQPGQERRYLPTNNGALQLRALQRHNKGET